MSDAGTLYADTTQIERWFARSKPGDSVIYAMGPTLDPKNPTVALVKGWLAAEQVVTHNPRRDGVIEHIAKRRACAALPDLPAPRLPRGLDGTPEGAVLRVLARCANMGLPCPSNAELAKLANLRDAEAARYRFNNLRDGGHIEVKQDGTFNGRQVMVASIGRWTAEPALGSAAA